MGDQRRAGTVVVTRRQEDRHPAAGRAQGRRHVSGRDAGQRRPSGPPRLEVSAARRSGCRDDQPGRHRRRYRQDHAPADAAGLPPCDVRRQHRHGRISLEPGRVEARLRVDRSVPQEFRRQARRHRDRRSPHALHRNGSHARADARAVADPLGHERSAVVLAARRHRADVSLRLEDRPAEEQDHVRCRADHPHRQARSRDADDVVRGGRQGEGTGPVLHAPLSDRARRQEQRLADARQRHARGADLARRQVRGRHCFAARRRARDDAARWRDRRG